MTAIQSTPTEASPAAAAALQPRCPNCHEPLLGEFCYACGQPKTGFIRHLSGIIGDFLDTVFNIDSRTLRTLLPLYFKPGFLSLEYFEGRRVRYVTPLRLYFFFSVLAFLAVSWVAHVNPEKGGSISFDPTTGTSSVEEIESKRKQAVDGLNKGRAFMGEAAYREASASINAEFDAMLAAAKKETKKTTETDAGSTESTDSEKRKDPDDSGTRNVSLTVDDSWDPSKDPIKIGWLGDTANSWLNAQATRIVKNARIVDDDPDRFLQQVFRLAPQTLFVMLPLFALMLKCFFIFKRRLYMEHLIVALHSHSFLCLSILLLVGLNSLSAEIAATSAWQNLIGVLLFVVSWWIPIHLLIAQKRIYKQGWFVTLFKYGIIGTCYTVLLSFGIVFNMILSLASL